MLVRFGLLKKAHKFQSLRLALTGINGEKKRALAVARQGGKYQWSGIRRRSVLERRKLESRGDRLKLTRKAGYCQR